MLYGRARPEPWPLVLPTTVVLSIPLGALVLVGGPPTISLTAMAFRVGKGAQEEAVIRLERKEVVLDTPIIDCNAVWTKRAVVVFAVLVLCGAGGFLAARALFSWYVFSEGMAHGQRDNSFFLNKPVYLGCGELPSSDTIDLVLHLSFELPWVHFDGSLNIDDSSVQRDGVPRTVFAGPYRDEITIQGLCRPRQGKHATTELTFYFADDSQFFAFGMANDLPVLDYGEVDVRFTRFHAQIPGHFAIVSPSQP